MSGNFVKRRIVELVRADSRVVMALADLGISPRYVYWTLEEAAADLQLSLDRVISGSPRSLRSQRRCPQREPGCIRFC